MKETGPRGTSVWVEALQLAIDYASGDVKEPKDMLEEIVERLDGGIHDIQDLKALMRIAERVKDNINEKSQ